MEIRCYYNRLFEDFKVSVIYDQSFYITIHYQDKPWYDPELIEPLKWYFIPIVMPQKARETGAVVFKKIVEQSLAKKIELASAIQEAELGWYELFSDDTAELKEQSE